MNPGPAEPNAAGGFRARWLYVVLIVAAAFAGYHNSFNVPFVFDDASSITTNPTIRKLWPLTEPLSPPKSNVTAQGRPVLNLSLAINYAVGGADVRGYHVGNLLVHTSAGLLLFGIVRRTLRRTAAGGLAWNAGIGSAEGIAFAVAALWTVHPLQTESVTYTIQRAESLMGFFYLLTFYCFVRSVGETAIQTVSSRSWLWQSAAVASCAAGMATKEVMATAPLLVLIYDGTFVAPGFGAALRLRFRFYAGLAATWLLLAWLIAQTGGNRGGSVGFGVDVEWWDYWLTQFPAIGRYLVLSIWPFPLVFEYGTFWVTEPGQILGGAVAVLTLLFLTLDGLRRRSASGFLGAAFFGILAPTSLAPGTTQMIVEHRLYLPLAAVLASLVIVVARLIGRRGFGGWLVGLVLLAGIVLTIRRNEDYRTDVDLWRDTIAKKPGNALAHFMLARVWESRGDSARAFSSYEEALRLKPEFSVGHENLGQLLLRERRAAEAILHFQAALRIQPQFADAHMNLGNALLTQGKLEEAIRHLSEAVRLAPETAEIHFNLANAFAAAGRSGEAIAGFREALKRTASSPEVLLKAHYRLANLLAMTGRQAESVTHYEAALRMQPNFAEAHHNLGSALFELGRLDEAAAHYEATLRIAPEFPNARENLARIRARLERR